MIEADYEHDVATRTHTRTFAQEERMAFSSLDCVLNGEKGIYASSELTTGRRAYDLVRQHGAQSVHHLREMLGDDPHRSLILDRNCEEAGEFARRLRAKLGAGELVITPAPFEAPGWSQAEYLHFWETLIRTRVKAVYFNEAWQYSNGCTFEFAVACEAGVPTFDADGEPLPLERAIGLVEAAVRELEDRGLQVPRLRLHVERLHQLRPVAAAS
jgi:hypothetical protein